MCVFIYISDVLKLALQIPSPISYFCALLEALRWWCCWRLPFFCLYHPYCYYLIFLLIPPPPQKKKKKKLSNTSTVAYPPFLLPSGFMKLDLLFIWTSCLPLQDWFPRLEKSQMPAELDLHPHELALWESHDVWCNVIGSSGLWCIAVFWCLIRLAGWTR